MLAIYYVFVSADPLILHAECSPFKLLSMFLKKKFLHALVLGHRNLGVFGEGWKMFKMTLSKQVGVLFLRFLNKCLLNVLRVIPALGKYIIRFHLSTLLETGFPKLVFFTFWNPLKDQICICSFDSFVRCMSDRFLEVRTIWWT